MQIVINDKAVNLVASNGQIFANTLDIAKVFGKEHKNVLAKIRSFSARAGLNFKPSSYTGDDNTNQPMYEMNRDGFAFLAMGFTGKKAEDWKLDFIDAFNQMENELRNPKQLTNEEKLQVIATETIEIKQEIAGVRHDVEILKNDIALSSAQKRQLQISVNCKVASFNPDDTQKRKLYKKIWRKLYDKYAVASYMEIPRLKFEEAKSLVDSLTLLDMAVA